MCADCFDLATEDHLGHLKQAEAADRRAKAEKKCFLVLAFFHTQISWTTQTHDNSVEFGLRRRFLTLTYTWH